jgi:class 3 adenylate cyclase
MNGTAMSEAELSQGSGAAPEFIHRLVDLGIVPGREGERPFVLGDVYRIRLAEAFQRSGIPLEAIGTAIGSGHLSLDFVDQWFAHHTALTGKTFRGIADDLGLSLETLTSIYAMWGLPRPGPDDVIREDDAPTFSEWKDFFPAEALNERLLTHGARLFGETTSRLADWGFAVFHDYVEAPMLAAGMSAQQAMESASAFSAVGTPMMERQLSWLLRRKLEHNAFQLIVEHVENAVEAAGGAPPSTARSPAISFIDLSGYTALTEEIGDEAAADRAGTLGTMTQELALSHGGRVVKLLGDGAMLHFPDPSEAVVCGLEMVERLAEAGFPPARVGIAAGPVVFRDGDCYGRVVNVASRVMDHARPGQTLATPEVVTLTAPGTARFHGIGPVQLKGIASPIELSVASPSG